MACQACIASKCRCVKNSETDTACVRCIKRKSPCIVRATVSEQGENVGKTAQTDGLLDIDTPTLHNLWGSASHLSDPHGTAVDNPVPGVVSSLFSDHHHGAEKISPLSISALLTPYGDNLLNDMPTMSPVGARFDDVQTEEVHKEMVLIPKGGILPTSPARNLPHSMNNGEDVHSETISNNETQDHQAGRLNKDRFTTATENSRDPPGITKVVKISNAVDVVGAIETGSSKTNSDDIDYNLRKAFAYNSSGRQPSELDDEMNWVNKFDLCGVQNSIRNVLDVANGATDTSSDVLESYITSKRADFFSETSIEKYFDQLLDFDSAFYDTSPLSDKDTSLYKEFSGTSPQESRDSRSEAFVGSSLSWKKPSANAPENEVKSVGDNEINSISALGTKIDRSSPKFKRFQVLPKTRDLVIFAITEAHNGQFWKDTANVYLPSAEELTLLVIEYFERFHTRYHIIHLPTFNPNKVNTLLLLAVIGAGAFFSEFNDEALNKIGRYFFEIGRRKVILEFEGNNSNIRDIQLQQATLILFTTASWSGIDRNVELSESFTFTLATMTRRGDMFKQVSYHTLQEIMDDQSLTTSEEKWRFWVISESKKLLVYVLFYWCSQFSVIMNFPSFINYSELELPLPHLEPFWRASNANDWLKLVESLKLQSPQQYLHHISFQLLIGPLLSSRDYSGPSLSPKFFTDVIIGTLNATVRQFVTEQNDRVAFTNSIPKVSDVRKKKRRIMSLDATFHMTYLVNRQAEIENMLESLETYVSNQSPRRQNLYKLEIEYSFVCLYASIKDCMKLAGIDGEAESRQSIPRLLEWFKKDDSRLAIWHCAQILKLAQLAISNNICMLLWKLLTHVRSIILILQSCPFYPT